VRRDIGLRVLTAFACLMLFLLVEVLLGFGNVRTMRAIHEDVTRDEARLRDLAQQVSASHILASRLLHTLEPARMDSLRDGYRSLLAEAQILAVETGMDPDQIQSYQASLDHAIDYQYQFATNLAREHFDRHGGEDFQTVLATVNARHDEMLAAANQRLQRTERRLLLTTGGVGLLAMVVSLGWVLFLQRSLTDRRRAEQALHERERNLAITLDSIGDGVIVTGTDGRIERINPVAARLTGWEDGSAQGEPLETVFKLRDQATHDPLPSLVDSLLADPSLPQVKNPDSTGTAALHGRDGVERLVRYRATAIRGLERKTLGTVVVIQDVTIQAELEERVRQTEKMDAVGQLAGGVAHDFNNMLLAISGYAQLLEEDLPKESLQRDYVDRIQNAASRSADLVRQLLDFSRKSRADHEALDLHAAVHESVRLLERSIDPRISLQLDLAAEQAWIEGDSTRIQNALLNLCLNARDAMPEGGTLRLATRSVQLDANSPVLQRATVTMQSGPYICLEVQDSGTGISPEVMTRIFEPFFTTKVVGKGTGLGLAAVYGTVRDHAGLVEASNVPTGGARFSLYFPVTKAAKRPHDHGLDEAMVMGGSILVVDDQDLVRDLCRHTLNRMGYRVIEAVDGLHAEEVLGQHRHDVDLVMLDLVMPRRNGVDTYRALRPMVPEVPIVLMSGFTRDDRVSELLANESLVGFLEKPFDRQDLRRALAEFMPARG